MKKFLLAILILFELLVPQTALARNYSTDCSNRYVTFVNPVRSRNLWEDKSLKPFLDQRDALQSHNYAATWLIQYDNLSDEEFVKELKTLPNDNEVGVLLEVSESYAQSAKVFFNTNTSWFSPKVIFLSAYERSERERLIDELYKKFYHTFGYYPQSVGAWWIDSYSIEYIKQKYGIKSVMIVADQLSTDHYGVWGQWWGVPYFPRKENLLIPASNLNNKFDAVVIQWAQRHPEKAYGNTSVFSNYSLQANDYIRLNQPHQHFIDLVNFYLSCDLPLGQITVGLETGQESVDYINEYSNQLESLSKIENLKSLTMSQFGDRFKEVYPGIVSGLLLESNQSSWELSFNGRRNEFLNDLVEYKAISFADYFKADKSEFLDRNLTNLNVETRTYEPFYLLALLFFAVLFFIRGKFGSFVSLLIIFFGFYGLFYRSHFSFGWEVYFGPVIYNLQSMQFLLLTIFFSVSFWVLRKRKTDLNSILLCIILSFGIDGILHLFRYTVFEGKKIFAFSLDSFNLIGISISNGFPMIFKHLFPAATAGAIYKVPIERLYENSLFYFAILPLIHILIGLAIWLLLKRMPKMLRYLIISVLTIFVVYYFYLVFHADPLKVIASR